MPEPKQNINKVIYGGTVLIDLTADTVTADKMLTGVKAHDASGASIIGNCNFDMNTDGATATASEILSGKTAGIKGSLVSGTMKNNGAVSGSIVGKNDLYTVPQGFHDGSGKVGIDAAEKEKLIPQNIREGITILGIAGSMSGTEGAKPQAKEVIPTTTEQQIQPDEGYNYLSQVTVKPIPYAESMNPQNGLTVTIG